MARRQVSIFVNGKQVENQLNSVYAAKRQITAELNRMVIGTEEYIKKAAELQQLNGVIRQHQATVASTEKSYSKLKAFAGGFIGGLVAQFSVGALVNFGQELFRLGTEMEVLGRKAQTVFGDALPQVTAAAEANANAMGLTVSQYTDAAAAIGDLLVPMGFQREEAANISTELVDLSGALSEWTGGQLKAEDVTRILGKAVLGEREELKQLGISIKEADVSARLAQKGLSGLTGQMLEQAKAAATLELITEKSVDAQNAYAANSDTLVRKQAELRARFMEIKETLATALVPVFTRLLEAAVPVVETISEFVKEATAGEKAAGKFSNVIDPLRTVFSNLGKVIGVVVESAKGLVRFLLNNFAGAIIGAQSVSIGFYNALVRLVNGFIDLTKIKVGKLDVLDPSAYAKQIKDLRDSLNAEADKNPVEIPVKTKQEGDDTNRTGAPPKPPKPPGDDKKAEAARKAAEKEAEELQKQLKRLQEIEANARRENELAQLDDNNRRLEQIRTQYEDRIALAKELEAKGVKEATASRIELERLRDEAIQAEVDKISEDAYKKEEERLLKQAEARQALEKEIRDAANEVLLGDQELALLKIQEYYEALIAEAAKYGVDTASLELARQQQIAQIQEEFQKKGIEELRKRLMEEADLLAAAGSVVKDIGGAISSLYDTLGDKNYQNTVLAKGLALVQIAISTAEGIAKATAAGAGIPFPGNLPAIAAGVASVLSNIAAARAVLSQDIPQRKEGGWLGVRGADDGQYYKAKYIGQPVSGMLPGHPVLLNTSSGPVLASERGPEYFVSNTALRNPAVMNYVQAIDNIVRTRQFQAGGFTTPLPDSAITTAPADNRAMMEMIEVNRRLLSVLEAGIFARVDDDFISDLRRRQAKLNAASGGVF